MSDDFTPVKFDVKVGIKTTGAMNFRQMIELKNMDFCKMMTSRSVFPPMNYVFQRLKQMRPDVFHECPYTVRTLSDFQDLDWPSVDHEFFKSPRNSSGTIFRSDL